MLDQSPLRSSGRRNIRSNRTVVASAGTLSHPFQNQKWSHLHTTHTVVREVHRYCHVDLSGTVCLIISTSVHDLSHPGQDLLCDLCELSCPAPMSMLSEDLWKHILRFLPYPERLGTCRRVNWALNRAAAAATQEVMLSGCSRQRFEGLRQWLLHNGQHITCVQLSQGFATLRHLPCPNLRNLELADMTVQLGASSTQPGMLHSCTRLTKLQLDGCHNTDGQNGLVALSALVWLQHLDLYCRNNRATDQMPSTMFQHLQQLTHLDLRDHIASVLTTHSVEHISCLVNLQELCIESKVSLSPSTTPGISRLTALHTLSLQYGELDPVCLQDCTQLQVLELSVVTIISADSAAALHSLVGRLQQLQFLKLYDLQHDGHIAAAAYSSLTASSELQKLVLTVEDLPPGAWQQLFPHQLPELQEVFMQFNYWDPSDSPPTAVPGPDEISWLVTCCPGLRDVEVNVQPDSELAGFANATGLTSLSVSWLPAEAFESLSALSGMVSLQGLSVGLAGPITTPDLLWLTALTTLTMLSLHIGTELDPEDVEDADLYLTSVPAMPRLLWDESIP